MTQRFKSLLGSNPELRPLLTKAQALSALQRHFTAVAPPYLAQSGQVLSLQHGMLNVAAANASVAAKLRQLAPELVVLLQNRGCEVSGIRVKVQVSCAASPPQHAPRRLGKTALDALGDLGSRLEDSPLKRALQKMIRKKG
ncbi:MAG: hypothetical protein A2Z95_09480 [Gallionellales bacterium GWA2_60_18]|nr:MAG: hypothetical protein A2Z95_09480 [Gallionellales bacterium GWA2_60_18]